MAKFGFDDEEEDVLAPTEPQVTSEDPAERKAARALRIKKRKDTIRKAIEPPEEIPLDEMTLVEKTIELAAKENQRLTLEASAKVTDVKVMTDEREVERRNLCSKVKIRQLEEIEEEAAEAQLRYEAVSQYWEPMLGLKDPLGIDAAMKEQKVRCDEILASKDKLIAGLKEDLKNMDIAYHDDLDKQDKDIKELSERIQKEIGLMQRAYETQLSLIEEAMNIERNERIEHNNKRWDALYKQRDKEECKHIDVKMEQLEEHKEVIESIMWDHIQGFREAKIELEALIGELQKELEKLKATCLINTEKIGYNYQVLKKREEENVFVRSQQKRKLNKMNDIANEIRAKIRKAAEDGALEEKRADAEIIKLLLGMEDIERKSNHFSTVNDYKFSQMWRMCASRAHEIMNNLRQTEIALHAHLLAEPPPPPPPPPPQNPMLNKWSPDIGESGNKSVLPPILAEVNAADFKDSQDKLIRHIFQLVADNTGFLVEDRLLTLIEKYALTSQNLCTLDSIFMALEIEAEEDINLLCETFLNYAFCPICVGADDGLASDVAEDATATQSEAPTRPRVAPSTARARSSGGRSVSASTSRSAHGGYKTSELSPDDQLLVAEADEILQKVGDPKAAVAVTGAASDAGGALAPRRPGARGVHLTRVQHIVDDVQHNDPFLCPEGHYLEIEPMQVLTALGEFIMKFVPVGRRKLYNILNTLKKPNFTTQSRVLKPEDVVNYWSAWKNIFPPEKNRFWDGMLMGLNKYLVILQERESIHDEVVELRRRNVALRQVLCGMKPEVPVPRQLPAYLRPGKGAFMASTESTTAPLKLPKLA